jgi:hypothetical protein
MASSPPDSGGVAQILLIMSALPLKVKVAQGSLLSLAAFPPHRGLDGAVRGNWDNPVGGAARIRTTGKAAGPTAGPALPAGVAEPFAARERR